MKLYLADYYAKGMGNTGTNFRRLGDNAQYAAKWFSTFVENADTMQKDKTRQAIGADGRRVMLVPGAKTTLEDYIAVCRDNMDIIEKALVLDVPGDPAATFRNLTSMTEAGINTMPLIRYGTPDDVIKWYVGNYASLALTSAKRVKPANYKKWLETIWADSITPAETPPLVHGHDMQTLPSLDWFSIDSTLWLTTADAGDIWIGGLGRLGMTEESAKAKKSGKHYSTLTDIEREKVDSNIAHLGFTRDVLENCKLHRRIFNALAMTLFLQDK